MRKVALFSVILIVLAGLGAPSGAASGQPDTVIRGQVIGMQGDPLTNVEVEIFKIGTGQVGASRTDSKGYFRLPVSHMDALYWVRVWAPGYRLAEESWGISYEQPLLLLKPAPLNSDLSVRVQDPITGAPVGGVNLQLDRAGRGRVASALTSSDGIAHFRVPAGNGYVLYGWCDGRVPLQATVPELLGGVARTMVLELLPASGTIAGVVVGTTGLAIEGATARAVRASYGTVATFQTGTDGSYRLQVPAGANYQILVEKGGYVPVYTRVQVAAGKVSGITGDNRVTLVPATGTVAGRVRDPDGRLLAGRSVILERKPMGTIAITQTDSSGRFRFAELAVSAGAQYRVRILPGDQDWRDVSSRWMDVTGGSVSEVGLQVSRGTFGDRGTTGGIIGTVSDPAGQPLPGVSVELWREGRGLVRTTTSGDDGSFQFTDVPVNGSMYQWDMPYNGYWLKVSGPGLFDMVQPSEGSLDVMPYRDSVVAVTVYPKQMSLVGQVVDQGGAGVPGAQVRLTVEGGTEALKVITNSAGWWRMKGVDARTTYEVTVTAEGYWPSAGTRLSPLDSRGGTLVVVLLPDHASLVGQVSDSQGIPDSGTLVTAWGPTGSYSVTAGADGWYNLSIPSGQPYTVRASRGSVDGETVLIGKEREDRSTQGSGAPAQDPLEIAPGETREVNLRLADRVGNIAGTVLRPSGDPVGGHAVELLREGQGVVASAITDWEGRYQFARVEAGVRYAVRPKTGGYRYLGALSLPQLFVLQPGTTENVHIGLLDQGS